MIERERYCPSCGEERTFSLAASMRINLGLKSKWHCQDCDYGFVQIDGAVDTGVDA
jgi:transposase-like protein